MLSCLYGQHPRFYSYLVSQGNIIEKDRCNDYYNSAVNVSERSYSMVMPCSKFIDV